MKRACAILAMLMISLGVFSQTNLEVEGKAKISQMELENSSDSLVVRLSDGTLALRDASTLVEYQIISISNDTIFLSNGGFIKLPSEVDGSITNEIQTISRSGISVTLSDGGGSFQDSVLSETEVDNMVSDNGYLTSEVDGSTTNELQTISRTDLDVTLSNGGGTFQDSVNVYTAGTGVDITNNVISTTAGSSSPWCLGKDTLGGIIFYIYKGSDGQDHGLIVAKTESTALWQSTSSLTNANRSWDGLYNTGLMTNSPAKTYVQTLGTGWYLPSIDEFSLLWHNRFHINKALFDGGYTLLSNTANYWSSTENLATTAWNLYFHTGTPNFSSKTVTYSVRGIRAF